MWDENSFDGLRVWLSIYCGNRATAVGRVSLSLGQSAFIGD